MHLGLDGLALHVAYPDFYPQDVPGFSYWLDSTVASSFTIAPAATLLNNGEFTAWTGAGWAQTPTGWTKVSPDTAANHVIENPAGHMEMVSNGVIVQVSQGVLVTGKAYDITVDVASISGSFALAGTGNYAVVNTTGIHTYNNVVVDSSNFVIKRWLAGTYVINSISITLTDDTNVSSWSDKYGSRSVVQATANNQLLYVSAGPYVEGDLISERATNTWAQAQPYVICAVLKPSKSDAATGTILDGGIVGAGRLYISAANTMAFTTDGANIISAAGQDLDAFHVVTLIVNGASSSIRVDGTPIASGNIGAAAAGGLTVGTAAGGTLPGDPQVKDVVGFFSAVDLVDIVRTEQYFKALRGTP